MATEQVVVSLPAEIDCSSGYCSATKTFHSLRTAVSLPPESVPLSFTSYVFSLLPAPLPPFPAYVDSVTGTSISFTDLFSRVKNLANALRTTARISKSDVVFILAPSCLEIPTLYLSLLAIGAIISPANPVSTPAEISRLVSLVNPTIAFATSSTVTKLPPELKQKTILIDSEQFVSFMKTTSSSPAISKEEFNAVGVKQSDLAAIQYSSGTTGKVKAVLLPHRHFIAMTAGFNALHEPTRRETTLLVAPLFHSLGFYFALKELALGVTTVVLTGGRGMRELFQVVERYQVTQMIAAPPVVVAMARSKEALKYDFSALQRIFCGGAALTEEATLRFRARFPKVLLCQGYGSTEAGGISRMMDYEECRRLRSVGRLTENIKAKIVDPNTGKALSVGQQGELLIHGPAVMIGYIGDDEANASTFTSDGWLKTGDLCYFDEDGVLYIVDRLKELIKYKAYQVPPAELEQVLLLLTDVVDAAVIPYPHEEAGQIPMAFIVRRQGSKLTETHVMDFVAKQVAPYKKIRRVAFIDSIPRSAAGKILRRELVSRACGSRCYTSRL